MHPALWSLMNSKPQWVRDENDWTCAKPLGAGGQGVAALFVKRDPRTNKIVDRVVVKETLPSPIEWNDKTAFIGLNRVPKEQFMAQLMPKPYKNTIEIFAHRKFKERHIYRLYMEYCAAGDLYDLLKKYKVAGLAFPEPFLWKLLLDLAEAVYAMDNPVGTNLKKDSFVAHVDFKPDDVFLCSPDPNKPDFPMYPTAKVADFGGAMLSHAQEEGKEHRDNIRTTSYTPGYIAPELHRFIKHKDRPHEIPKRANKPKIKAETLPIKVTTSINVWNAGLILADFMALFPWVDKGKDRWGYYDTRDKWIEDFETRQKNLMTNYSGLLKRTVISCLRYFPEDRPTPKQLLDCAKLGVARHCKPMDSQDCLDPKKYDGRYNLDARIDLRDIWAIEGGDDWDMMDDKGLPPPKGPLGPPPRAAKEAHTAAAGAEKLPAPGFLVGPEGDQAVRDFFGVGEPVDSSDRPIFSFERDAEFVASHHSKSAMIDEDGIAGALGDEMEF